MKREDQHRTRIRSWRAAAALAPLAISLAGCVSLDPSADIDRARSLVQERSGQHPAWNAPWSDEAQEWDGRSPLSADLAVAIALRNNRSLRAGLETIAESRADLVQAGLLPNPVLNIALGFPLPGSSVSTRVSAGVVQQLTDLWLRPARRDAAAKELDARVLGVSDQALRLVADVRANHAQIVFSQRGIALTQSQIKLIERLIDATSRRIKAGEASRLDANRLRQLLLARQVVLSGQEAQLAQQKRELLELLGLAATSADWAAQDELHLEPRMGESLTEEAIIDLARTQRLDVAAAETSYKAALHQVRVANLGRLPQLTAGAESERTEDKEELLGPVFEVEIPIFDTKSARAASAAAAARRAALEAESVRQRAIGQARAAWARADAALGIVKFYQSSVLVLAAENLTLAEQAYRAGQADLTVLLEVQRDQIESQSQLNALEARLADALVELEYAVGGRLDPGSATAEAAAPQPGPPAGSMPRPRGLSQSID